LTFLDLWERFVELAAPDVYKNNRFEARAVGCGVLNTATRAYIYASRSLPGNFYTAILGKPSSGKTSLMHCAMATIAINEKVTGEKCHVSIIPKSTPEALMETLAEESVGILFWDEVEEVYKKSRSYMDTLSNLLNQLYDLGPITFHRATKPKIDIPTRSYYFSVYATCLPSQWKAIEAAFAGGFERRWLTLNLKGKLPLLEFPPPRGEAAEILAQLQRMILWAKDKAFVVKGLGLGKYEKEIERRVSDENKQRAAAHYFLKLMAAEIVNVIATQLYKKSAAITPSQLSQELSQYVAAVSVTVCDSIYDSMGQLVTCDRVKGHNLKYYLIDLSHKACDSDETICDKLTSELIAKYGILDNVIRNVAGVAQVEEPEMAQLVERIEALVERGRIVMSVRDFVVEVVRTRNAQWYRPRVIALEEAGRIRTLALGRRKFVILDPKARICGNCRKFATDECPIMRGMPISELDPSQKVEEGDECFDPL
jgi:hypothetical protein